ncbi:MAG: ATP cone domain-containing protein [Patescibacteria group bacterium]
MNDEIYIIKANGEKELFDVSKLENSLRRAGADLKTINIIADEISENLEQNMTTAEIYRKAFELLNQTESVHAIRYSVKKAVMDLGPNGFSFEDFVGAMFREMGYAVLLRQLVRGLCVEHEVDFIAKNNEKFLMGEVKFHNEQGIKSDLKVVLYVKERFDDIQKGEFFRNIDKNLKFEKWLITNTKFTSQAIQYAECSREIQLMSWNYPMNNSLFNLIDRAKLYPITCLNSLSSHEKQLFLNKNIVLCREIKRGGVRLFNLVGIKKEKQEEILNEINNLTK